jgi:hypothetical protein
MFTTISRHKIKAMKLLALVLFTYCTFSIQAQTQNPASAIETAAPKTSHWGLHGMLVFGDEKYLYASHLPMFHAPHDRQVIFRFHISDVKIDGAMKKHFAKAQDLWTLEPQEFDLNRLQTQSAQALKQFNAQLYEGHFERGGKQRFASQTIIIDEVLVFNPLVEKEQRLSESVYYLIGQGNTQYLMKKIDRRPDFDVLMTVKNFGKQTPAVATLSITSSSLKLPKKSLITSALKQQLETFAR